MPTSNIVYMPKSPVSSERKSKRQNQNNDFKFAKESPRTLLSADSFSPWQRKSKRYG